MRGVILLALVLLAVACNGGGEPLRTAAPTPSPAATPAVSPTAVPQDIIAPPDTIVARLDDFNSEIYTVGPDGSRLTRITDTPECGEGDPAWAPDGRLAFVRGRLFESKAELIVTKADGSDPVRVAGGMDIMYPAWSPDGDRIAFLVDASSVAYQGPLRCPQSRIPRLFLADVALATSGPLLELAAPDGCPIASTPRWSPDGTKIALASRGVYVVDVASGRLAEIVPPTNAVAVAWSPDGQRLAVAASLSLGGPSARILMVDADGQGLAEIAQQLDWIHSLAWSPQGDLISVVTGNAYAGQGSLLVINPDGSGLRSLAQGVQGDAAWSPDGHRVAVALADPSSNIYTVDVDDGSTTRLTDVTSSEYNPVWSPDGSAIAFVSRRDAQSGIFAVHPDGTLTPLLPGAGSQTFLDPDGHLVVLPDVSAEPSGWRDAFPLTEGTPSPDGRRLADVVPTGDMVSERCAGDANDIYVWSVDGSQVTNLTNTPDINEIGLVWSPDSALLALTSGRPPRCHLDATSLEVIKADGTGRRLLADFSPFGRVELPEWVSEGSALLFSVEYPEHGSLPGFPADAEKAAIYTVNIDGTGLRQLLEFPDARIEWLLSPDRARVAVVEARTAGGWRALLANVDGTGVQEVARGQRQLPLGAGSSVRWSPDTSRLAYPDCQGDPCRWALFVVNADGSDLRKVVEPFSAYEPPTWSPDGTQLALVTHPEPCVPGEGIPPGYLEVVDLDSGTSQRLTERCLVRGILGWLP